MRTNEAVLAVLARHDGLITTVEAEERGMSARTLRRRASEEGWRRVAPGVLLAAGHPFTERARVRAVGLWADGRGAVSGPSAAWWHGMLPSAPARAELTVGRTSGLRSRPGVRVRRRDLDQRDVVRVDDLALTAKPLTVLETAAVVPDGSVFLDRALQKHVRFPSVYQTYCRNLGLFDGARITSPGVRTTCWARSARLSPRQSLLRRAGITGWQRGVRLGPWEIDLAFPAAKLAIEVDGWAWHVEPDRFANDRRKGNALVQAGWTLLRFTWHDLIKRPDYVLGTIRAALTAAA